MRVFSRSAALLFAAAHVAATLLPCPSPSQERVVHDGHLHVVADLSQAAPDGPPQLDKPCPCGCQRDSGAGLFSARLGFAEPAPEVHAVFCERWAPLALASVRMPSPPDVSIDPVPI